jgi:hypothetical protein
MLNLVVCKVTATFKRLKGYDMLKVLEKRVIRVLLRGYRKEITVQLRHYTIIVRYFMFSIDFNSSTRNLYDFHRICLEMSTKGRYSEEYVTNITGIFQHIKKEIVNILVKIHCI